jgi:hypothetical protein
MKQKRSTKMLPRKFKPAVCRSGNVKLKLPILYYAREIDTFFQKAVSISRA